MIGLRLTLACAALVPFWIAPLAADPCPQLPLVVQERPGEDAARQSAGTWTAVTLNLAEETGLETILRDLDAAGPILQADLFLLQEVLHSGRDEDSLPLRLARRLGYHAVFGPGDALPGGGGRGVAILSRFRIRDPQIQRLTRFDLRFKQRCRVALGVTVESPWGPIRVVNAHLDNRINPAERLQQLEPAMEGLLPDSGPQLVGGDFNTSNVLWLRRWLPLPSLASQPRKMREFMESRGFSTPFTSTGRTFSYLPLKLDWVFVKDLQTVRAGVEPVGFSDHRGLWVTFAGAGRSGRPAYATSQPGGGHRGHR